MEAEKEKLINFLKTILFKTWNFTSIFFFSFFFRQTHSKFKMTNRENWRAINTEVNCCCIPSEIVFCNNFYFDPILRFLQGQNYIKFHLLKWQILMPELQEFDDWYNIHSQFRFGQLLPIINDVLLQRNCRSDIRKRIKLKIR